MMDQKGNLYKRFHIETKAAPSLRGQPGKYAVRIRESKFAEMLLEAFLSYPPWELPKRLKSRPCIYGTYDRMFGGLTPDHDRCVACYRCVLEHPGMVKIELSQAYKKLGDDYWSPEQVWSLWYEASTGRIPVKGACYKGPFSGNGFDSMWTDMSEIVRPTRDGIHGREFISTIVDIGRKASRLEFGPEYSWLYDGSPLIQIPVPIIFDLFPDSLRNKNILEILAQAASYLKTFVIIPVQEIKGDLMKFLAHIIPLVNFQNWEDHKEILRAVSIIEVDVGNHLDGWKRLKDEFPTAIICLRLPFNEGSERFVVRAVKEGAGVFHLFADYRGREISVRNPRFLKELIRSIHGKLVEHSLRDEVTIITSGGIIAAEHLPKAIICGADLIALNTPLLVALQCRFDGDCTSPEFCEWRLPRLDREWGTQRLINMVGAWHGQLLEILGAMGLREVRRLQGETGRAMFFEDLEKEIFAPIFGLRK
ncbi:MAG: glutamate synthase-related protein [Acidobacteriota bacterium]